MSAKRRSGFTLIEVLIVVVIMAVLAATIIPQFSTSTQDAKVSALKFNLQTMRTQIEMYKVQHNGAAPTVANFVNAMTTYTDAAGNTNAASTGVFVFGPYIQGTIPLNPFTNANTITVTAAAAGAVPTAAAAMAGGGWQYRAADGGIYVDGPLPNSTFTAATYWGL